MSRTFTRNHLRILVLPTQLSKFLEPERESGQFFTSWDSAFFTELNNLSGVRKIFTGKISCSEFSLFMCVWASRWVFLDICRRMFGVYFTLCLPLGNARWKNEAKKSPEFCHFPEWSGAKRKQLNRWTDWTRSLGSRAMRIARLFGNFTNVPTKF